MGTVRYELRTGNIDLQFRKTHLSALGILFAVPPILITIGLILEDGTADAIKSGNKEMIVQIIFMIYIALKYLLTGTAYWRLSKSKKADLREKI